MLIGLLALLVCQLAGELLVRLTRVELPGPVVGMVIFLIVLRIAKPSASAPLTRAPSLLLKHLQLLFIPAGVGLIVYLDRLRDNALPLAVGLWGSWLLGLAVTGYVVTVLVRWTRS